MSGGQALLALDCPHYLFYCSLSLYDNVCAIDMSIILFTYLARCSRLALQAASDALLAVACRPCACCNTLLDRCDSNLSSLSLGKLDFTTVQLNNMSLKCIVSILLRPQFLQLATEIGLYSQQTYCAVETSNIAVFFCGV